MVKETLFIIICIFSYIFLSHSFMNLLFKLFKVNNDKSNGFLNIFYNVLTFSLILVSIVAIISTKGRTIFILCIPVLFLLLKNLQPKTEQLPNSQFQEKRPILIWGIIFIISSFITIMSFYLTIGYSIRNDTMYYVKIAECLIDQGIENGFHHYNYENSIFEGCSPYHYFELWIGSFIFKVNQYFHLINSSNYIIYTYLILNLFRVTTIIGLFGLLNKFVRLNFFYFLIGFTIFFLDISAFCRWWNESFIAESNYYHRPNFIFYYLFLIPIIDSLLNNKRANFLLWTSIFILCNITALPALGLCAFCMLALEYYQNLENRKKILKDSVLYFIFLLLIPVFYKIFGMPREAMPIENYTVPQMIHETLSIWKACVFMFLVLATKISLLILVAWLLSKTKWIKTIDLNNQFQRLILYLFLINIAGIGLFQLVPYLDNMYQFAYIGYCFTFLILTYIIILISSKVTKIQKIVFFLFYSGIFTYAFNKNIYYEIISFDKYDWKISLEKNYLLQHKLSQDYVNALQQKSKELDAKGASIIDGNDAASEFIGLRHSATYQLGNYLMAYNNYVNLPLLSNPEMLYPDTDKLNKNYYKAYNFNKLTQFYKNYDDQKSYKENLVNYIKSKNIKFLFASSSFNPYLHLDPAIIKDILKEKNKGHQLITLK